MIFLKHLKIYHIIPEAVPPKMLPVAVEVVAVEPNELPNKPATKKVHICNKYILILDICISNLEKTLGKEKFNNCIYYNLYIQNQKLLCKYLIF